MAATKDANDASETTNEALLSLGKKLVKLFSSINSQMHTQLNFDAVSVLPIAILLLIQ